MSFDTKYRPEKFQDVIGQSNSVKVLKELLKSDEIFHQSYIFAGPSGTGKTTTSRILARAMLCDNLTDDYEPCNQCNSCKEILESGQSPSFVEMDAANHSGKDNIQKIIESLDYYSLGGGDRKIYLIDESHRLSKSAMDALLKPMEDTIKDTKDKKLVCLFCTTEPQKMRGTIKGRCMTFKIKDPVRDDVTDRLGYICEEEGIEYNKEGLDLIFDYGRGHIRDMVNALERVSRVGSVTPESVRSNLGLDVVSNYYDILIHLRDDLEKSLESLNEALNQTDPASVYEGVSDASMAAYRISKGISVGMPVLEKKKASSLYKKYGDDTLKIAQRLLFRDKKIDKRTLISDLLSLQKDLQEGNLSYMSQGGGQKVVVEKKVSSGSKKKEEKSDENEGKDDVVDSNLEHADKAMSYGAKAARGETAVKDPYEEYKENKKPVNEDEQSIRNAEESDYNRVKDKFK